MRNVVTPLWAHLNPDKKSLLRTEPLLYFVCKVGRVSMKMTCKNPCKMRNGFSNWQNQVLRKFLLLFLTSHQSAQVFQAAWHLYYISRKQFSCLENIKNNFDLTLESCFKRLIIHMRKIAQKQLLGNILRKKIDWLFWGNNIIMI